MNAGMGTDRRLGEVNWDLGGCTPPQIRDGKMSYTEIEYRDTVECICGRRPISLELIYTKLLSCKPLATAH